MAAKCPNCETKTALYATEYLEQNSKRSADSFLRKRLREINNCPFCGAEISDA